MMNMKNKTDIRLMDFMAIANNKVSDKYLKSLAEQQAKAVNNEKLLNTRISKLELLLTDLKNTQSTIKNQQSFLQSQLFTKEKELKNALFKIEQLEQELLAKNGIIDQQNKKAISLNVELNNALANINRLEKELSTAKVTTSPVISNQTTEAKKIYQRGLDFEYGRGCVIDNFKAFECYKQAALLGLPEAQNNIAALYQNGKGTPKDLLLAIKWYRKAASQGNKTAELNLRSITSNSQDIYNEGLRQEYSGNYKKAFDYYDIAAKSGFTLAKQKISNRKIYGQ